MKYLLIISLLVITTACSTLAPKPSGSEFPINIDKMNKRIR